MTTSDYKHKLLQIIEIARLAPSVHNAQPWQVELDEKIFSILISPSHDRDVSKSDSTGRETTISLGIFAEACAVGAEYIGVKVSSIGLVAGSKSIRINLDKNNFRKPSKESTKLLKDRFTDRSIFKPTLIDKDRVSTIKKSWKGADASILCETNKEIIDKVAWLTKKGQQLAFTSDEFRHELSEYIVPSKKTPVGIAAPSLQVSFIKSKLSKIIVKRGWFKSLEQNLEYKKWASASGLVFIVGNGDNEKYWLEAGRAYLRASLAIQSTGLNQSTSAAIVEASDFHEDIEAMLGTKKRILSIIRIGKGVGNSDKYHSGRLAASEIIVT